MYIPRMFAEADLGKLQEFIESHSFATLVSQEGTVPVASHLPVLLDRDGGPRGTLIGHMARANSQWQQAEGQQVLAIFHGPHSYISASWYKVANSVPTWNYVAVHAVGVFRLVTDKDRLRGIVEKYAKFYEAGLSQPWSIDRADSGFVDGLLAGIVGFEIPIETLEGKWKLNQNHDEARRQRVIDALRAHGGSNEAQIAGLMADTLSR